jgi:RES domain-containing protein
MILTELGPVTAYRMHTPKWATAPTSGGSPHPGPRLL